MRVKSMAVRPVALGLSLLALAGGYAAYSANARTVAMTVDGHKQQVSTHGSTVGVVLSAAHLTLSSHDLLAPAKTTKLSDGTTVVVRRGREMTLTVDGKPRTVWVTAQSVDEALSQVGLRSSGMLVSADRSREIPLKGFSLDVRTRKNVQLVDAGKVHRTATNGRVVSDVLREMRVHPRAHDRLSVTPGTAVRDGLVIRLTRIDNKVVSENAATAYNVQHRSDSSMYVGDSKVLRSGHVGLVHRTYRVTYVNHKLSSRRLATAKRMKSPVTKIVASGTKVRAQAPSSPSSSPVSSSSSSSSGGLNWAALANCESGGDPRAVNGSGTYRGLYQFSLDTWHSTGASGDPINASSSEQTSRAQILYSRSGAGQWPVCGKQL